MTESTQNTTTEETQEDFFVGYLPASFRQTRFLKLLLALLIPSVILLGILVTTPQQDPGGGVWEVGTSRQIEGVADLNPYASLRFHDESSGEVRTVLLVSSGKFGAVDRVKPFAGQSVRVEGTLLHRDGRWLLELADGEAGISAQAMPSKNTDHLTAVAEDAFGEVTLRGEIIDPKCYIGAMKPGGGKTHKACAQLCVGGGIPPMFVTRDEDKHETFYLLVDNDGGPANGLVIPYLGDPVELTGRLSKRGDLLVIHLEVSQLRRL